MVCYEIWVTTIVKDVMIAIIQYLAMVIVFTHNHNQMDITDSNGNTLVVGDSVIVIKDLPVKWGKPIKRGTKVKNIRLYSEEEVEGKVDWVQMVLKTMFIKKG